MPREFTHMSLRVPPAVADAYRIEARRQGIALNALMTQVMTNVLLVHGWQPPQPGLNGHYAVPRQQ